MWLILSYDYIYAEITMPTRKYKTRYILFDKNPRFFLVVQSVFFYPQFELNEKRFINNYCGIRYGVY